MKLYKLDDDYNLTAATEAELNSRPKPNITRPQNAEKVYQGKIFTVYNWQQELFDGTKTIFETLSRTDSVNVIPITKYGKFILTKQEQPAAKPFIGAIGGRVDEGETFLEASIRELHEEAGISANECIGFLSYQGSSKIDWAVKTFFVRDLTEGASHYEAGEKIELAEYTFDEFVDAVTTDGYRDWEITLEMFQIIKASKLDNLKRALIG